MKIETPATSALTQRRYQLSIKNNHSMPKMPVTKFSINHYIYIQIIFIFVYGKIL